jgi:hypothetical protein
LIGHRGWSFSAYLRICSELKDYVGS